MNTKKAKPIRDSYLFHLVNFHKAESLKVILNKQQKAEIATSAISTFFVCLRTIYILNTSVRLDHMVALAQYAHNLIIECECLMVNCNTQFVAVFAGY